MPRYRNRIIYNGWILDKLNDYSLIDTFDCGDSDLNDYFRKDVKNHKDQLLTKTYTFMDESFPGLTVALVDLCNDSVRREKINPFKIIPEKKSYPDYPSVKISRLGVEKYFHGSGIGSFLIITLKEFFLTDNRTGCRFITVDAYNNPKTLNFYTKNGFKFFNGKDSNKNTRHMFFDLLSIKNP